MADVIPDAEGAPAAELILEVHRVEDARTVTQRLHVPAEAWRAFLDLPASVSVQEAYEARRDFWDWLAEEYADTEPGTPSDPGASGAPTPDVHWLREKQAEWQAHH